jgi:hypothetical protein
MWCIFRRLETASFVLPVPKTSPLRSEQRTGVGRIDVQTVRAARLARGTARI